MPSTGHSRRQVQAGPGSPCQGSTENRPNLSPADVRPEQTNNTGKWKGVCRQTDGRREGARVPDAAPVRVAAPGAPRSRAKAGEAGQWPGLGSPAQRQVLGPRPRRRSRGSQPGLGWMLHTHGDAMSLGDINRLAKGVAFLLGPTRHPLNQAHFLLQGPPLPLGPAPGPPPGNACLVCGVRKAQPAPQKYYLK